MTKECMSVVQKLRGLASDTEQRVTWRTLAAVLDETPDSICLRLAVAYLEGAGEMVVEHASESGTYETHVKILRDNPTTF